MLNDKHTSQHQRMGDYFHTRTPSSDLVTQDFTTTDSTSAAKVFGQLVVLGFDVTVFTPAPYQRHRL